jgi:alpha-tubulin suppressor-like RCC1 family protein
VCCGPNPPDPANGNVVAVSVGAQHSCALRDDGRAFCWGRNDHGQLGDGTKTDRSTPVAVAGGLTFAAISAGERYTCGVTAAGQGYCWGDDMQLEGGGSGTRTPSTAIVTPTPVGGATFASISAGLEHTCGVSTGGTAYCWGTTYLGAQDSTLDQSGIPMAVVGGPWLAVQAGANYSCTLATAGAAYCWGPAGDFLGDGDGTKTRRRSYAVASAHAYGALSAGTGHVCAIAAGGALDCWGDNQDGQLGVGAAGGSYSTPQAVVGGRTYAAVSAGDIHTCAVETSGIVDCWGRGTLGQLGTGETKSEGAPRRISAATPFADVSAGSTHTCGVSRNHNAFCWGSNVFGERGDGVIGVRAFPVAVKVP